MNPDIPLQQNKQSLCNPVVIIGVAALVVVGGVVSYFSGNTLSQNEKDALEY